MFRALLPKPFHINIDESCILKGSLYYPPLFSSSHPIYSTPSLSDTAGVGDAFAFSRGSGTYNTMQTLKYEYVGNILGYTCNNAFQNLTSFLLFVVIKNTG